MKKDTNVKLTKKWWTTNKSKTLKDKGNLGTALKTFEDAYKLATVSTGQERAKRLKAVLAACTALETAATKTAGACLPKIHSETKHVLKNTFPAAVKVMQKDLQNEWKTFKTALKKLKVGDIIKDRTWRVLYMKYAKAKHSQESINFLLNYSKKNDSVYNEYIKEYADQQINIDYGLRVEFDTAHQNGNLKNAPWDKAVKVINKLIQNDDLGAKFSKYVLGE